MPQFQSLIWRHQELLTQETEGISLQELQVAFISILLSEIGRLSVAWWYPPDFQTGLESVSCPDKAKKLGLALEYTHWWYTGKGRKVIDRAFFGSVVKVWVHKNFVRPQCCCCTVGPCEENIRGLGFHRCMVDKILGASPLICVTWHPISSSSPLDERAANVILEAFQSLNAKKPLPLFDPSTLPEHYPWELPQARDNLSRLSKLGSRSYYYFHCRNCLGRN